MSPEALQTIMAENHLNAKKTADILSVHRSAVYRWLSGDRVMPKMAWDLLVITLRKPKSLTIIGDQWGIG